MPKKKDAGISKQLLCPMPGLVKTIDVVEGQEVKAGDVLARIDSRTYQASFDQAVAKLAQDEANLVERHPVSQHRCCSGVSQ